ncbi:acetoacetate metabolism regulatory protein AtoC [Dissulfurispira thermophila]|uniref:Acetoacetate metabolism regulatory protein AtoC n=2 Tax=root TaxID=1 RepID=A0A7G1GZ49_9BACT|nr:sigma-54 dependent transcriptional regulator [Dissulfurispira thermophila]BCB95654.1 acetoacetate metabolism regulatory protein AtoC [Dissulfurispira thermophila]
MRALIVDDEQNIRKILNVLLKEDGFDVHEASNIINAEDLIKENYYDIAIIDLRLSDGSGIDILKTIKKQNLETVVLIITAFASTETAIAAMKLGAYDYVTKPFNLDELRVIIRNIKEKITLQKKVKELQQYADEYHDIIGKSDAMKRVFNMIEKIAPFDTNVIITGQSGTGKELVAKAIHRKSTRADMPFIAINCATLPEELLESELFGYTRGAFTGAYASKQGLIEEANGGTLFLDEIGEMPLQIQAKLLRFLEEKKIRPIGSSNEIDIDIRIIAATNKSLKESIEKGEFREDLYYRLSTFEISLPSLKDRKEDIPLLINHFVKLFSKKFQKDIHKIEPAFVNYIMQHELKGNVRELKNIIEKEVILSEDGCLKCTSCPVVVNQGYTINASLENNINLNEYLSSIEKDLLNKALQKANGVKTKAAELLGLTFREFRYRLSKYKLKD